MDLQLSGKRAIVTGGSRGIGKAVARELAREGVAVVIAARSIGPLAETAAELTEETSGTIVPIVVDTGDDDSVAAMVDQAVDALGGVDILVNSAARPAGQSAPPKLADITDDAFYSDVNVKVMGYLRCARQVAPHLIAQRWGRIINISGLGARQAASIVGSMRNVAVAALTKNLADELGPHGVNVTVVHPGITRTEASAEVFPRLAANQGIDVEELERRLAANVSIGRIVEATEVASIVAFLASPRSVAITGDAVACGGGSRGAIYY